MQSLGQKPQADKKQEQIRRLDMVYARFKEKIADIYRRLNNIRRRIIMKKDAKEEEEIRKKIHKI